MYTTIRGIWSKVISENLIILYLYIKHVQLYFFSVSVKAFPVVGAKRMTDYYVVVTCFTEQSEISF